MGEAENAQIARDVEQDMVVDLIKKNINTLHAVKEEAEKERVKEREKEKAKDKAKNTEKTEYTNSVLLTNYQLNKLIQTAQMQNKEILRLDNDLIPQMQEGLMDLFYCTDHILETRDKAKKAVEEAAQLGVKRSLNEIRSERTAERNENHAQVNNLIKKLEEKLEQWQAESEARRYLSTIYTAFGTCALVDLLPRLAAWAWDYFITKS